MWRKRQFWFGVCALLVGCTDLPVSPRVAPSPDERRFNTAEFGEGPIDPPKDWPVVIKGSGAWVTLPNWTFEGNRSSATATLTGSMDFNAYHASIGANAVLRERDGTVIQRQFPAKVWHASTWGYKNQYHKADFPVLMQSRCGGSLEGDVTFRAWWWGFSLEGAPQALEVQEQSKTAHQTQDACQPCPAGGGGGSGGGGVPIRNSVSGPSYDPYDEVGGSDEGCDSNSGDGSGGGGDSGSGTQFGEGDYTGGETVDWGTGTGNGGTSECGTAAQVRYVCIDVYIDGEWRDYACGWATTC